MNQELEKNLYHYLAMKTNSKIINNLIKQDQMNLDL